MKTPDDYLLAHLLTHLRKLPARTSSSTSSAAAARAKYRAPEKGAQYPKAILAAGEARRRRDAKSIAERQAARTARAGGPGAARQKRGATKQGARIAEQTGHNSPGCGTKSKLQRRHRMWDRVDPG